MRILWSVAGALHMDLSVGAMCFVWKHIRKVQMARQPVDGQSSNSVSSDSILDDVLDFCAVWSNPENSVRMT